MFCGNCGKAIADDAKFCDGCGAAVAVQGEGAPVVATPNPIFENFVKRINGFFSLNSVKTVGDAAKSSGLEWLLFAGIAVLAYAIALGANIGQAIRSLIGAMGGYIYNFGSGLLYGLLLGAGTYFLMSVLIFLTIKVIYKKQVSITNVFNMVAVASMPLACVYIANIIFGFIWTPLVIILSVTGMLATAILLYAGMQKLVKFESSPFLAYVCIWAIVVAVVCIILAVIVSLSVSSAIGGAASSLSGLSSLPSIY